MILLLPHAKVAGWEGPESLVPPADAASRERWTAPQVYHYYDIDRFYDIEPSSDAMAAAYYIPSQEETYRLNKAALRYHQPFLRWVIFDLDRPGHEAWPGGEGGPEAEAALDRALEALAGDECLYETVNGYTTRAGMRLMWRLSEPGLPVPLAKSLLQQFGAVVAQRTGLEVDTACYQWTRLFRIPRARRDGRTLTPVVRNECAHDTVDYAELVKHYGWELEDDYDFGGTPAGDRPDFEDLKLKRDEAPGRPEWMKLGDPVPPDEGGSTYRPLRNALVSIAARYEVMNPEVLYALAYESAMATPKRTQEELWKMAAGVAQWQEMQLAVRQQEETTVPETAADQVPEEHWKRVDEAARRSRLRGLEAKVYSRWRHGERTAPKRYDNARVRELVVDAARFLAPLFNHIRHVHAILMHSRLDRDELWALATEAVTDYRRRRDTADKLEAFLEEWPAVLICLKDRYFLDTTRNPYDYVRVNGNDYIDLALEQFTRPGLPEGLEVETPMSPSDFLRQYGRILRRKVYVSGKKGTTWTPSGGGELHEAIHALDGDLVPRRHEDVARYLELLGGHDHDLLLDWLSHVTYTGSRALPALLLRGEAGGGKTLLPKALARLWGAQPADYNKVTGTSFQSEMRESPLLLADEGIKEKGDWAASFFRQLVTNGTHKASIKNQDEVGIRCFFRVVVTANKDDDDPIPLGRALGEQGIQAVQQRVLHVDVGTTPGQYLVQVGRERINTVWLDEGALAQHVLWLRDNHRPTHDPKGRLAVTPRATEWHRSFAHNQGDKPLTAEVLRKLLMDSRADLTSGRVMAINDPQDRAVWVSPDSFIEATQQLQLRLKNPRDALRKASSRKATEPTRTYLYNTGGAFKKDGPSRRLYRVPWDVLTVNEVMHEDELSSLTTTWRRRKT